MNTPAPNQENQRRASLTTADLAESANRREGADRLNDDAAVSRVVDADQERDLEPLFGPEVAGDFRAQWNVVQQGFVDDPARAVQQGDELVAQVIKNLAETFAQQRAALEGERGSSTEDLRVALRRYRSFFERLLSI